VLNVFNLLQWCFSRLIPARSSQMGMCVNPRMATLTRVSLRFPLVRTPVTQEATGSSPVVPAHSISVALESLSRNGVVPLPKEFAKRPSRMPKPQRFRHRRRPSASTESFLHNTARLFLAGVQFVEYSLQLFKLLSSVAELALRSQALIVGEVFGALRDERVENPLRAGVSRRLPMFFGPTPPGLAQSSSTRRLHRKGTPGPTRRSVRMTADLVVRVRPDAIPASDSVRPAGKSAPHRVARAQSGSQSRAPRRTCEPC